MTLTVRDLHFTYPGWPATLAGIELDVAAGTSAFLLGPSGSGKSTLLRCIAGLERRYTGTVAWQGAPLDPLPPHERGVGMLFQEPALFPHLTVWQNVAFAPALTGASRAAQREQADRWLDLAEKAEVAVDQLSGGQRQRVALARTLAARPRVVLLDEPLNGLDRDLRDELGGRVKRLLAEQEVAALWVTHDRSEAERLGDHTWDLHEGALVPHRPQEGAP